MRFLYRAAIAALLLAVATPAQSQTADQYQAQLNAAVCTNNWTEALSVTRTLIGSTQTTPQYRQQLVIFRNQLENYRASNTRFDRSSDANCQAAITAAPQEVAALQTPSRPLNWEQSVSSTSSQSQVRSAGATDQDFWNAYRRAASTPGYTHLLAYEGIEQVPGVARSYCAELRSGRSFDSVDEEFFDRSSLPGDFAGLLKVAAVYTYCPEYFAAMRDQIEMTHDRLQGY